MCAVNVTGECDIDAQTPPKKKRKKKKGQYKKLKSPEHTTLGVVTTDGATGH